MKNLIMTSALALLVGSAWAGAAQATERTVTLSVDNMTCVSCSWQVERSLERVDGVMSAKASMAEKRAVVTFDEEVTTLEALTRATASAGFPSRLRE
ncbi:MAG: cation transporter [Ectothiorhodospiraceae bacterium]|nr:cation transporter [Ectothiorhodospiraceae bacterium]